MLFSFKYKELQIVKHALQHYVTRAGATEKDISTEKRLLEKIITEIEIMKEKYCIK